MITIDNPPEISPYEAQILWKWIKMSACSNKRIVHIHMTSAYLYENPFNFEQIAFYCNRIEKF